MAINNTNTVSTKLGVDTSSTYIRLEIYLGTGQKAQISYHVYPNKLAYTNNEEMINKLLNEDFSNLQTDVLTPSDVTLENLHDLAIAELVARGMDNAKLAKTDLV